MDRIEKEKLVANLHSTFEEATLVVVAHYSGLTVAEVTDLRRQMLGAGAGFKVTKNRLTRLALKDTSFEGIADLFKGPTAIAFSSDPVAAAKVASEYAKKNSKFTILGGAIQGSILDANGVETLAKLPSLDQLRGKIIGVLQAPATKVAGVLQAPAGQLARVMKAYSQKEAA